MHYKTTLLNKLLEHGGLLALPVLLPIALGVGVYSYGRHIQNNLEPGAIYFGLAPKFALVIDFNLPLIKNTDIDRDGRYESVIIYLDDNGKKAYQRIVKTDYGGFIFSEPEPYPE